MITIDTAKTAVNVLISVLGSTTWPPAFVSGDFCGSCRGMRPWRHYNQRRSASKRPARRPGEFPSPALILRRVGILLLIGWAAPLPAARADVVLQTPHVRIVHAPSLKHRAGQMAAMTPALIRSLERDLGLPFDLQPTVVPAPNRSAFRRLGGREWFTAFAVPHKNQVVIDLSRLEKRPEDLYSTLKHEYAHLLLHHAIDGRRLPRWLDEGVAQWASDGLSEYLPTGQGPLLPQAAAAGRLFYLDELSARFPPDHQGLQLAYEQSRSFVNYLVRLYGAGGLRLLLQSLAAGAAPWEAFEEAFGVTLAAAEDDWRAGLRSPGSWLANLAGHLYGLLFFLAALATCGAYLRFRYRKRHYRAGEEDDSEF
jgi:hypothetical protein